MRAAGIGNVSRSVYSRIKQDERCDKVELIKKDASLFFSFISSVFVFVGEDEREETACNRSVSWFQFRLWWQTLMVVTHHYAQYRCWEANVMLLLYGVRTSQQVYLRPVSSLVESQIDCSDQQWHVLFLSAVFLMLSWGHSRPLPFHFFFINDRNSYISFFLHTERTDWNCVSWTRCLIFCLCFNHHVRYIFTLPGSRDLRDFFIIICQFQRASTGSKMDPKLKYWNI